MNLRAQIITPVVDLRRTPGGPRARQVLFGETVRVGETKHGWSQVAAEKDGYCGYVPNPSLGAAQQATHWISAPSSHVYAAPDLKSPDRMALSFASRITVTAQADGFVTTSAGHVPAPHVTPLGTHMDDPLDVAGLFIGTPYLWGGNSRFGIDCSGLVQAAFVACGRPCPGDSVQQRDALGAALPPGTTPRRNDLLFFEGHVAMVCDRDTLLHANAWRMAVSYEPLRPALERIAAQGDGTVVRHIRPETGPPDP